MEPQSSIIPVAEAPGAAQEPMHLRYLSLLRANLNFRRLWLAQLISEIGDWFYSLALYDLLLRLTGSGKAVSWAIIIQTLPWFLMTPLAGHIVDRFPRRRLMIAADIIRGFVVLGLLLVRARSQVWLIYFLLGLEVLFASLFEPARNALLPDVASADEILAANAIGSATWSTALAVGAALGGMVTALAGRQFAFFVNSLSFFASAVLVRGIHVQETHLTPDAVRQASQKGHPGATSSLTAGARYLKQNPKVLALATAKTGLGALGGSLLLLAVFGERIFATGNRGAMAMGWLYAARGVGAGVGPIIGGLLMRGSQSRMWKSISLCYFLVGISYLAFSHAPSLVLAILAVFLAHTGGSNVWVVSTTLLQLNTDERFRGRVFALDFGLIMLAVAGSNYVLGLGLDSWGLDPRLLAALFGCGMAIPGVLWLPVQAKWAERSL